MGSQISIGKKLGSCLDGDRGSVPGPGNYNIQANNKKVSGGMFGVKFVTNNKIDCNLGPGQYEVQSSFEKKRAKSAKGTFGSSRTKMKPVMEVPGPGQYSLDE